MADEERCGRSAALTKETYYIEHIVDIPIIAHIFLPPLEPLNKCTRFIRKKYANSLNQINVRPWIETIPNAPSHACFSFQSEKIERFLLTRRKKN